MSTVNRLAARTSRGRQIPLMPTPQLGHQDKRDMPGPAIARISVTYGWSGLDLLGDSWSARILVARKTAAAGDGIDGLLGERNDPYRSDNPPTSVLSTPTDSRTGPCISQIDIRTRTRAALDAWRGFGEVHHRIPCYSPAWRSTSRSLTSATESLYAASESL